MEIATHFRPVSPGLIEKTNPLDDLKIADFTLIYQEEFPDWISADVILVGCGGTYGSKLCPDAENGPNAIRKALYKMAVPRREISLADLGDIVMRDTPQAYYAAIADVVTTLVKAGKIVILMGGSQDIAYGQYLGYEKVSDSIEYVAIDSELDVQDSDFGLNQFSYNHKIFVHSPNYLSNFTNLGYQTYFVPISDLKRMKNLFFQAIRIGELKKNINDAEPFLRNADMVSFDLSAVRHADAPGTTHPSPAGFSVEEACQIARFIGMANRVTSLSLAELHPSKDVNGQAALCSAIFLWYFIEGVYNRKVEEPETLTNLKKFFVPIHGGATEIIFVKNLRTDRWWMEVPYQDSLGKLDGRMELIPCSEKDYQTAQLDEIPERWWMAHHKLK